MELVRYADRQDHLVRVGVRRADRIAPIEETIAELLRLPADRLRARVEETDGAETVPSDRALLLPPIDGMTEVWAAGVTYERSKVARTEESVEKSVYERVYDAERPELFFKAPAWRVVTDGEPIGIRDDSELNVPEPELGLVVNSRGEIVGYFVCNDVSSRTIEGENPLYLPQAKVYAGSCAMSTGIALAWDTDDPADLAITMSIVRDGAEAWRGETSTARIRRALPELVAYLFRGDTFPDGVCLATGTGIVPEMSFTLAAGDRVDIEIQGVGRLSNPVVVGKDQVSFLTDALRDPFVRAIVRGGSS